MHTIMSWDETRIQMFTDFPTPHAQRMTVCNWYTLPRGLFPCMSEIRQGFLVPSLDQRPPCGSSWINRPIPSWLLPLWQESLCSLCLCMLNGFLKSFSGFHEHSILKRGKQQLGSGSQVCTWAKWPIRPVLIPVSVAWSDREESRARSICTIPWMGC